MTTASLAEPPRSSAFGGLISSLPLWITAAWIMTAVRFTGEYQGWLSNEAGGGSVLLGVGWMVPAFGLVAGLRAGPAPTGTTWRSLALLAVGLTAMIGNIALYENFKYPFTYVVGLNSVIWTTLCVFAFRSWPRVGAMTLAFAIGSRLSVLAATVVCLVAGLEDMHYVKVGASDAHHEHTRLTGPTLWFFLALAQVGLWIPFTVLVGGSFATLGARLGRR